MVVTIYEDLLRHGGSYSTVCMVLVDMLETPAAVRRKRRNAELINQLRLEKYNMQI